MVHLCQTVYHVNSLWKICPMFTGWVKVAVMKPTDTVKIHPQWELLLESLWQNWVFKNYCTLSQLVAQGITFSKPWLEARQTVLMSMGQYLNEDLSKIILNKSWASQPSWRLECAVLYSYCFIARISKELGHKHK